MKIGDIINFNKSGGGYYKGRVVHVCKVIDHPEMFGDFMCKVCGIDNHGSWAISSDDVTYCPENGEYYDNTGTYYTDK